MINKIFKISICTLLTLSILFIPTLKPNAKTINDYQRELDQKQAEYNKNKKEQDTLNANKIFSQQEIKNSQAAINKAEKDLISP